MTMAAETRRFMAVLALLVPLLASFIIAIIGSVHLFRFGIRTDHVAIFAYLLGAVTYFYYPRLADRYDIEKRVETWVNGT